MHLDHCGVVDLLKCIVVELWSCVFGVADLLTC